MKNDSTKPMTRDFTKAPETEGPPRVSATGIDDGSPSGASPLHGSLRVTSFVALAALLAVFVAVIVYPRLGPSTGPVGTPPESSPPAESNSSHNPETGQPTDAIAARA